MKELILLFKKQGKTILICSHLLSDIEDIVRQSNFCFMGGKIRAEGTLNELLKVKSTQTITTPVLTSQEIRKLLKILKREYIGKRILLLINPRMSLESFFLDVIDKARNEKSKKHLRAESGGKDP